MFFLGTISAIRDGSSNFDGSATPDLALIDSEYRDVVWIDAKHPSQWEKTVYDQLNEAWRASEGIGEYFVEEEKTVEFAQQLLDSIKSIPTVDKQAEEIIKLQRKIDSIKALKKTDTIN